MVANRLRGLVDDDEQQLLAREAVRHANLQQAWRMGHLAGQREASRRHLGWLVSMALAADAWGIVMWLAR